jgi:signal transduction histidine kinase
LLTVIILHFHEDGQLRYLEIMNLVTGIIISTVFVHGAIDLAKRNLSFEAAKNESRAIQKKYVGTRELLFRIDNETREEVGAWLHGTLQPQLVRLAQDIRTENETNLDRVAQRVDEISEKFVRSYSHSLFPPALMISLEVGLETLLEGRAELTLDPLLTNASTLGFAIWSPESASGAQGGDLRLDVGVDRAYATYRIVEEAVANAEKKASVSRITVDVCVKDGNLRISVLDNGDPIPESAKVGLGLSVIDAFVQKYEGNMVFTNVDSGVSLIVLLPYQPITVAERLKRRFGKQGLDV